jgi:hypothetical protein
LPGWRSTVCNKRDMSFGVGHKREWGLGGKNQNPKTQRAQRDHAEIAERTLRCSATDSVTYLPIQPLEMTERCDYAPYHAPLMM